MSLVDTSTGEVVVLLSEPEARKLTADIKAWAGTLWLKLEEAHRGQAWRALGYSSWEAYLDTEFDISRSRGYQLVKHAQAVRALAAAAGVEVSTIVDTPEGQTRDLDLVATAEQIADDVQPEDTVDTRVSLIRRAVKRGAKSSGAVTAEEPTEPTPVDEDADPALPPAASDPGQAGVGTAPTPAAPSEKDDLNAYLGSALKAELAARNGLLSFDVDRLALTSRDPDMWLDLAGDLVAWATALEAAVSTPNLRSVPCG